MSKLTLNENIWSPSLSYGRVHSQITDALRSVGFSVSTKPHDVDLVIDHPGTFIRGHTLLTFWDSTELPPAFATNVKRFKCVIATCDLVEEAVRKAGVTNVKRLTLGRPVIPMPMPALRPLTFYSISADHGAMNRKRAQVVINAFRRAFPAEKDVRLFLKQSENCFAINRYFDERIVNNRAILPSLEFLHEQSHVFVSASAGEAWGYPHHDAIAHGRPVICGRFGSPAEILSDDCAMLLPVELRPPSKIGPYAGIGNMGYVHERSLAFAMRQIYEDKILLLQMGANALRRATQFTAARTAATLHKIFS